MGARPLPFYFSPGREKKEKKGEERLGMGRWACFEKKGKEKRGLPGRAVSCCAFSKGYRRGGTPSPLPAREGKSYRDRWVLSFLEFLEGRRGEPAPKREP